MIYVSEKMVLIWCFIENSDVNLTTISCTFLNKGDPSVPREKMLIWGKKRKILVIEIEIGSVDAYLVDQRRMYQEIGEPEPPIIPNA